MHRAKYPEVEESYENCHTDIYFKTQTGVAHAAKCWTQCHIFPSIQFSHTQCFEAPTALSLSLMLSFYRTNVEPIDQIKSNLS